jgi:hypothetical protein
MEDYSSKSELTPDDYIEIWSAGKLLTFSEHSDTLNSQRYSICIQDERNHYIYYESFPEYFYPEAMMFAKTLASKFNYKIVGLSEDIEIEDTILEEVATEEPQEVVEKESFLTKLYRRFICQVTRILR